MQSPQAKLKQIRRILALWPSQAVDDGEEMLRGYLLAVEDYPAEDVELAVDCLVKGIAPGVKPNFRPNPAETGSECCRQMGLRLRREEVDRMHRPQLPPPDIQHTPESRARAMSVFEAWKANQAAPEPAIVDAKASKERAAKHQRWLHDRGELIDVEGGAYPVSRSLMTSLGYSVGDADGEADAA